MQMSIGQPRTDAWARARTCRFRVVPKEVLERRRSRRLQLRVVQRMLELGKVTDAIQGAREHRIRVQIAPRALRLRHRLELGRVVMSSLRAAQARVFGLTFVSYASIHIARRATSVVKVRVCAAEPERR